MAMELRLVADADMPLEQDGVTLIPPLMAGMVRVGTADTGEGIYDCLGSPPVGTLLSKGKHRVSSCPWAYRRRITVTHKWAGERA